ncbi:hypothetical protein K432DRAFT_447156 [Lepidopterella palustris CBS 459.81]|uniref:Uncharacterized protein n=1 Tax=Lepidopterella palustris CBS 459.81 TaxID=1314670 RepID=A0A8E2J9W3_9PEZI|nr:hypothetical protein K432DRAFT_447156 [Lepidopterella palustris CBS 459.81]
MGKSRRNRPKGTPQRKPFIWSINEVAALLAWADRCVERNLDFKDTVVQQLKQKWPQRDYKYDVIESKLKRLWDRMGKHGTDKLDIITKGTQCLDLDCFDDAETKALYEAKSELLNREMPLRGRSRSKVNSPRAEPYPTSARSLSIHLKIENEGVCRRSPRIAKRVGSSQLAKTPSTNKSRSSSGRSTRLQTEIPDNDDAGAQTNDEITANALQDGRGDQMELIFDHNLSNRHSVSSKDSDSFDHFINVLEEKEASISHAEARILTFQELIRERDSMVSALGVQNEILRKSNMKLSNQVSRLSREITGYQTSLKVQDDCWKVSTKHPEANLMQAIKENEETITYLKRQLYECQKIALPEPSPRISHPDIVETMGHIEDRAKAWSHRSNITFSNDLINSELDPNTADILRRSLLLLRETVPIEEQIVESANDVDARNVLRALVAAVLREWVFESDFHNFDDQESEVLAIYRKILLGQQDGPRLVRSFDFVAIESLFMEQYFQEHILVDRAEELTAKFIELLAPFFPRTTPDSLADGIAAWAQNKEDIAVRCKELFQKALKLKTDLMLTTQRYEMRTFEPGTPFNPASMVVETKEGAEIRGISKKRPKKVKLCLFPALYSYPAETLTGAYQANVDRFNVSRLVVQCRNFLRSEDDRGQEEGVILRKAVVLLENGTVTSTC